MLIEYKREIREKLSSILRKDAYLKYWLGYAANCGLYFILLIFFHLEPKDSCLSSLVESSGPAGGKEPSQQPRGCSCFHLHVTRAPPRCNAHFPASPQERQQLRSRGRQSRAPTLGRWAAAGCPCAVGPPWLRLADHSPGSPLLGVSASARLGLTPGCLCQPLGFLLPPAKSHLAAHTDSQNAFLMAEPSAGLHLGLEGEGWVFLRIILFVISLQQHFKAWVNYRKEFN